MQLGLREANTDRKQKLVYLQEISRFPVQEEQNTVFHNEARCYIVCPYIMHGVAIHTDSWGSGFRFTGSNQYEKQGY